MDLSIKSEPGIVTESQRGASDPTDELRRIESLNKELTAQRFVEGVPEAICCTCWKISCHIPFFLCRESIERVCQEAQALSESGRGSGEEVRVTGQLQMEYQALLKAARERLQGCQESQAFGDTLQGVWVWLEEIQERLGTVDSTIGTKEQLEQRLETVQVRLRLSRTLFLQNILSNFFCFLEIHWTIPFRLFILADARGGCLFKKNKNVSMPNSFV